MSWPPEHKSSTRQRIVEAAAKAYREFGLDGISTAEIMKRAGLTHGGFYAHCPSKDALVAEALEMARADTLSEYGKVAASTPEQGKLLAIAESYLSSRHREHPETGCPIAALGSELPRQNPEVREKFGTGVLAQFATLARSMGYDEEASARLAAGTFAAMVGGIILARALPGSNDADRFLAHVREFVRDALAADSAAGLPDDGHGS